ncbi:DMT family transporter [Aeromicrobium sp. IC_218]|uniref:EamA family transporter n=1 Tax=Aeromicrobium sp. IC_218 TaxID=2545468 RepID=UPI00104095C9|nr:DMT family transporter [Aeromicrobium sp. IC_218]TCI99052.1 DMT family transporter [Aeromicrobium sp. IC_218]
MTALTDDTTSTPTSRVASGVGLALLSAVSFGLSGPLAKSLIETGWSAGSAVLVRVLVAAGVLLVPALLALRGRWTVLRRHGATIAAYGLVAVAGCQLAYFQAVARMEVGPALLIEFMSPVAVIGWLWLRHGQRPGRLTVTGALAAIAGLVLVIDLLSGAAVDVVGVLWALGAMTGAAVYWIVSAGDDGDLPGVVLAAGGLLVGGLALLVAGLVGVLHLDVSASDVVLADTSLPWWFAVGALGVVTAALSYVLGIAAVRRLGSRLASFVGLSEALAGVVLAWLLLGEQPRAVQVAGGALVLAGVVLVRLGEPRPVAPPVATPVD